MSGLEIDRVQIHAVWPVTPRYTWAEGMPKQFMTSNIVRLTTRGGLGGVGAAASYSEGGCDCSVGETLRHLVPQLIGATARASSLMNPPRLPVAAKSARERHDEDHWH